jgi:hypothetical protein
VLERIAADLDSLGLVPNDSQADKETNQNLDMHLTQPTPTSSDFVSMS